MGMLVSCRWNYNNSHWWFQFFVLHNLQLIFRTYRQGKISKEAILTDRMVDASLFCMRKPETINGMVFQFSYTELEQSTNNSH
uniref:Receptor-like serine/threonine-protein kinase NCRK n=1 Tax=Noccaea caerulescens TaxID=107243 RepID=A0A1J3FH14_NOCCA